MHQSTTPSLSQAIWPRRASRQFLSLPIVQTLLPVTFAYSLSSKKNLEAVVMRQLRRWKRLWQRLLTHSHKRTSMGPSRSCWNGTTSALQLEELLLKGMEFRVYTINKSAYTKKSGNLSYAPCIWESFKNFWASPRNKSIAEKFGCGDKLSLLIKLEKLIQISMPVRSIKGKRFATNLKSGRGLALFEQYLYINTYM